MICTEGGSCLNPDGSFVVPCSVGSEQRLLPVCELTGGVKGLPRLTLTEQEGRARQEDRGILFDEPIYANSFSRRQLKEGKCLYGGRRGLSRTQLRFHT